MVRKFLLSLVLYLPLGIVAFVVAGNLNLSPSFSFLFMLFAMIAGKGVELLVRSLFSNRINFSFMPLATSVGRGLMLPVRRLFLNRNRKKKANWDDNDFDF